MILYLQPHQLPFFYPSAGRAVEKRSGMGPRLHIVSPASAAAKKRSAHPTHKPTTASRLRPIFHGRAARKTKNPFPHNFFPSSRLHTGRGLHQSCLYDLQCIDVDPDSYCLLKAGSGVAGAKEELHCECRKVKRETARVFAVFILCNIFSVQIPGLPFRDLRGQGRRRRRGEGGEPQMRARYAMYKKYGC